MDIRINIMTELPFEFEDILKEIVDPGVDVHRENSECVITLYIEHPRDFDQVTKQSKKYWRDVVCLMGLYKSTGGSSILAIDMYKKDVLNRKRLASKHGPAHTE